MGCIRTTPIKNMAKELIKKYPDKFSNEFGKNKQALIELNLLNKNLRNKVAGYIVKLLRRVKE